jgi:hypothetical protein
MGIRGVIPLYYLLAPWIPVNLPDPVRAGD